MINLGDRVRDVITDYVGIAISRTVWHNGCVRYGVQGKIKDGVVPKEEWVDEAQLEVVKPVKKKKKKEIGGPTPNPQRAVNPRR